MQSSTSTVTAHDGTPLFVYRWLPEGRPTAVVQIAHGMAEHAGRYARLAESLTGAGYAVYAHDHRGHGQTATDPKDVGYFADGDGWGTAIADMLAITRHAKGENPDLPVVLLGHSMGSLLGRSYAMDHGREIDALVLSGTGGDQGLLGQVGQRVAALEGRLRGRRHTSSLMNTLTFGAFNKEFKPARTDFDWLSRDDAEVDKYLADPACGKVFTSGFFTDLLTGVNAIAKDSNVRRIPVDLPIYLLSGDRDPVGDNGKGVTGVRDQLLQAGVTDVTMRLYPQARHELFNETNRDEVVADLLDWLATHAVRRG